MKPDPIRLLDDTATTSAMRVVLEAGRDTHPVVYDEEAAAARFRALLAGGAVSGAIAAGVAESLSGTQGLRGLLGKAAVKVGLAVVIPAAGVYAVATSGPGDVPPESRAGAHVAQAPDALSRPPPPPARPPGDPVPMSPGGSSVRSLESLPLGDTPLREAPSTHGRPRVLAPPASSRAGEPVDTRRAEPASSPVVGAAPAGTDGAASLAARKEAAPSDAKDSAGREAPEAPVSERRSAAAEEMRGVMEARALQRTNPGQALEILARLKQKYPRGYFLEERRAITVRALFRSGDTAQARKQGAAFLEAYPNGPFTDEIRAAMDR